jgi:hypothetical protein
MLLAPSDARQDVASIGTHEEAIFSQEAQPSYTSLYYLSYVLVIATVGLYCYSKFLKACLTIL